MTERFTVETWQEAGELYDPPPPEDGPTPDEYRDLPDDPVPCPHCGVTRRRADWQCWSCKGRLA